jgi:MFS family permease
MEQKTVSKRAGIFTILLFVLILVFNTADQNLASPMLNPMMLDFFGSTADALVPRMSWITSLFIILSGISMVIFGMMADRHSRKKICLTGSLIFAIPSILSILIPHGELGYFFFFLTRAVNGIGIGAIIPSIFSMVGDTAKPDRRTTVFSYISLAMILGQLIGMITASLVETATGNWRIVYFAIGIINLVLALGILGIQEPKRGIQEEELKTAMMEGAEYNYKFKREDLKILWTNRSNFWLIANFIDTIPSGMIFFLLFKYFEDIHNLDSNTVTLIVLVAMLSGGISTLLFGKLGDVWFKKDLRAKVLIALFCNGFPVITFIIFLVTDFWVPDGATLGDAMAVPGFLLAFIMVVLTIFINQGVGPNWYSTLTDINLPEHRATVISMASFTDILGRTLGPILAGVFTASFGLQGAMWIAIIFWVLNTVLWFPIFYSIKGDLAHVHEVLSQRAQEMKK